MVKHNNVLPNAHFRKEWDMRVKTWLDQPARKQRRRAARQAKAVKISPRPVAGALRPVVRCPTQKYNMKLRAGRGFTLEEIKAAGLTKAKATSIGIAVDHRRSNKSTESLAANTDRLKLYLSKLVLPTRPKGSAKGVKADFSAVNATAQLKGQVLPVPRNLPSLTYGSVSQTLAAAPGGLKAADGSALYKSNFEALRKERANARLVGIREKKAKEAAAKDAAAAKKAGKAGDAEEA